MRRYVGILILWLSVLAAAESGAQNDKAADRKGTVVAFDNLKSVAPATWVEEKPSNNMRFLQFQLPKAKDDKEPGELIIFKGLGGDAKSNIKRWKEQFAPPEGKAIDDVAKVTEMKVAGFPASYLDVEGTYQVRAAPFDPKSKLERKANYRMLAVHFEGPQNIYHIKLVGPAKTVAEFKAGFDEWLKNFK